MNKKIISVFAIVIIVIILLIGGYFMMQSNTQVSQQTPSNNENNQQQNQTPQPSSQEPNPNPMTYEVIYTENGYSPSTLNIKAGDTVTFKNQSSSGMWVGSAMHPTHVIYSGTSLEEHCPDTSNSSFDQCRSSQPGESWSFTFNKKGEWGYHNHVNSTDFGKIIVQ